MSRLIMIADDSPTIRKIVEVVLSREGYEVVAAPDGVAACTRSHTEHTFSSPYPSGKRASNGADRDARDDEATDRCL